MPELPEVELYRRLAERTLGRVVDAVDAPDAWYLKRGTTPAELRAGLVGRRLSAARRIGKLLLLDMDRASTIGLRFGMSGRLVVDGLVGTDVLIYASNRDLQAWDRFGLRFTDGGHLRVRDPRRLGGVELDPDLSRLGPDALGLSANELERALTGSRAPLKSRLMDQTRLAGVGNLIADEALWRAGLDPARSAGSLTNTELGELHQQLLATISEELEGGGSHTGNLVASRVPGGVCPRDGVALVRRRIGGRTSWSCPIHQR